MKIELSRQEAEALMELAVESLRKNGHNWHLYQAVERIVMSCGMVKDEAKLTEYMAGQLS